VTSYTKHAPTTATTVIAKPAIRRFTTGDGRRKHHSAFSPRARLASRRATTRIFFEGPQQWPLPSTIHYRASIAIFCCSRRLASSSLTAYGKREREREEERGRDRGLGLYRLIACQDSAHPTPPHERKPHYNHRSRRSHRTHGTTIHHSVCTL